MSNEVVLLVLGWLLGLISSILTSLVMYWLEGKRQIRVEASKKRLEDIRVARNWINDKKKISLRGFDLRGANLSGKDLSNADLEDANLEGAELSGTNLSGANLIHASFRNVKSRLTNFSDSNLRSSDFTNAELIEPNFTGAQLKKAKLGKAKKIENGTWDSVKIDETTDLPDEVRKTFK